MCGAMFSKSLIQFSVDNFLCSLPVLYLGHNYGGGNEDNVHLLRKVPCMHCYTQCPQPCSRPPLTHASARDSWTLMGKTGSVSYWVTAPFSWVLVHTRFCLCPPRVCFQSCVSSGSSLVGLMVTSSKRAYAIPRSAVPRAPAAPGQQATADPYLLRRHPNTVLSQSLWGLWVLVCTRFV